MITKLFSATLRGIDACEVEVEVNARGADKPMTVIVGKTFSKTQLLDKEYLLLLLQRRILGVGFGGVVVMTNPLFGCSTDQSRVGFPGVW